MRLSLDDLGLRGGQRRVCTYPIDMAPVVMGGERYEVVLAEGVTVSVERIAGGYLIGVELAAKVFGPCVRCLEETGLDVHAEEQEFVPTAAGGWAESDASPFVEGLVVDISGLCREALVLAMPERVLCVADCKGLCPLCGAELNRGECGCAPLELS